MKLLNKKRRGMITALAVCICMLSALVLCFAASDTADAAVKKYKLVYKTDKYATVKIKGKKPKSGKKIKVGTVINIKSAKGYTIKSFMVSGKEKVPKPQKTKSIKYKIKKKDIKKKKVSIKVISWKVPVKSKITLRRSGMIDGKWGGSVSAISGNEKAGKMYVEYGESKTISISQASGYCIAGVTQDGKSLGRTDSVVITGDGQNHKINVDFAKATLKIKVDPGHAGKYNKGAVPGYWESETVWKLSNYLKPYLNKYPGIKATLTKSSLAEDPLVYERGRMAKGNDLFLSIHSNSSDSSRTDYPLTIVSYSKKQLYNVAQPLGVKLAECVRKTMKTNQPHQVWIKLQSDKRDWYGVIRGASDVDVPGIIIEHSFHSNPLRAAWLMQKSNLKSMAKKEAKVIASYYGLNKDGTVTAPEIPADCKTKNGAGNIKVSWKKGPVTGYKVLRSAAVDGKYSEIANTSKRSFTDSGLKSGKTYYYKVRAYRCNGVNIAFSDLSVAVAGRAK